MGKLLKFKLLLIFAAIILASIFLFPMDGITILLLLFLSLLKKDGIL